MSVHCTIYNIKHNPAKNQSITLKIRFSIFIGLQNGNENGFHGFWKFGNLAVEKFWKYC